MAQESLRRTTKETPFTPVGRPQTTTDVDCFVRSIKSSLMIRSHLQLFTWLQGELQALVPHDVLIAAWGDFSLGLIQFDVISNVPGVRTQHIDIDELSPFMNRMFAWWDDHNRVPLHYSAEDSLDVSLRLSRELTIPGIEDMSSVLVHGIKDERGRHDCLYVALGRQAMPKQQVANWFELLLPYIDTSLRQVALLPDKTAATTAVPSEAPPVPDFGLSGREAEIMQWVCMGKTNQEIGMILDISAFTVKNHLQRIFRKLNVMNRAQAVAKHSAILNKGSGTSE